MQWQRLKVCHFLFGEFWLNDVKSLTIGDLAAYKRKRKDRVFVNLSRPIDKAVEIIIIDVI